MPRQLPDPDINLRDAADFILVSKLGRRALTYNTKYPLSLFWRDLISEIHRLVSSCHMPEFTDHGLPHLCSLIDRISLWTCAPDNGEPMPLVGKLSEEEAAILLTAVLIHDIGMLSQKPEDLPPDHRDYRSQDTKNLADWVRKTHVDRISRLVRRLFNDYSHDYAGLLDSDFMNDCFKVAKAHNIWPWKSDFTEMSERKQGLSAVLAVADLLDEDPGRCDTQTLLHHRQGTILNRAHWIRHGLTSGRVLVEQGIISVTLARPPGTGNLLFPVYDVLRNHYRLTLQYRESLKLLGAGDLEVDVTPEKGDLPEETNELRGWNKLPCFENQLSLLSNLLSTFFKEALLDKKRVPKKVVNILLEGKLEPVDLDFFHEIHSLRELRSEQEEILLAETKTRANMDTDSLIESNGIGKDGELLIEPSLDERREKGRQRLKDEAIKAHRAGNSALVNHCCALAIANVLEWGKENNHSLPSKEDMRWTIVLPVYWYADSYMLLPVRRLLGIMYKLDDEDSSLSQVLHSTVDLTEASMTDLKQIGEKLESVSFDWLDDYEKSNAVESVEDTALLELCVELLFILDPWSQPWESVLSKWQRLVPCSYCGKLERLQRRLDAQRSLLYPDAQNSDPPHADDRFSASDKERYILWRARLENDWDALEKVLAREVIGPHLAKTNTSDLESDEQQIDPKSDKQKTDFEFAARESTVSKVRNKVDTSRPDNDDQPPTTEFGTRGAKARNDFIHSSAFYIESDDQIVRLTRGSLMESKWPERSSVRTSRFYKQLSSLQSKNARRESRSRTDCFRLVMFSKISALRDWNLSAWMEASQQEALACQALLRFGELDGGTRAEFAIRAFESISRAGSLDAKNPEHVHFSQLIDTAPQAEKIKLVQRLTQIKPYAWDRIPQAWALLSDAMPEDSLAQVAEWSLDYSEWKKKNDQFGDLGWFSFWGDIFEYLAENHEIFTSLFPIMEKIAGDPVLWRVDFGRKDVVTHYLRFAPFDLAKKIAEKMFSRELCKDGDDHDIRWSIIYNAAHRRKELREHFRDHLIKTVSTVSQKVYLRFLQEDIDVESKEDDPELRKWILDRTKEWAGNILKRSKGKPRSFGEGPPTARIPHVIWPRDSIPQDLLQKLISVVDDERSEMNEPASALRHLDAFLRAKPDSTIPILREPILNWLKSDWQEEQTRGNQRLNSFFGGGNKEDRLCALLLLASSLAEFNHIESGAALVGCLRERRFQYPVMAMYPLTEICVLLGLQETKYMDLFDVVDFMNAMLLRAEAQGDAASGEHPAMLRILNNFANLMDPDNDGPRSIFYAPESEAKERMLEIIGRMLRLHKGHLDVGVRVQVARLSRYWHCLKPSEKPKWYTEVVETLEKDARARVRHALADPG
jgi:hypothetical protein